MRKLLLAGSTLVALAVPHGARAQIPVTDAASLAQRAWQQVETLGQWTEQARSMATQIASLNAQLRQAQAAYAAVTGVRDLGSAMYALNVVGIQNPLPIDPLAVQSLISGQGNFSGINGTLNGLQNIAATANRVYTPSGSSWRGQEMVTNANSLAGVQALAQRSYQAAAERLGLQNALRARLAVASDPKEVADLQAATAIVQADIASHQQQLQAVGVMAQAQTAVRVQRDDEQERRCIDKLIAYYAGASTTGECPPPSAAPATTGAGATAVAVSYGGGNSTAAGASPALDTMLSRSWGQQAADNATRLGVNPTALAATCVVESGCQNVNGTGTVSGAFQMTNSTYTAAMRAAGGTAGLEGKMDPAVQSLAAAQELKSAAISLQNGGIASPSVLDTRAIYQWGAGAGPAVARANDGDMMSAVLPGYSADVLRSNGITPGVTTVGQWRQGIINKVGPAALQPALLGQRST